MRLSNQELLQAEQAIAELLLFRLKLVKRVIAFLAFVSIVSLSICMFSCFKSTGGKVAFVLSNIFSVLFVATTISAVREAFRLLRRVRERKDIQELEQIDLFQADRDNLLSLVVAIKSKNMTRCKQVFTRIKDSHVLAKTEFIRELAQILGR